VQITFQKRARSLELVLSQKFRDNNSGIHFRETRVLRHVDRGTNQRTLADFRDLSVLDV
jgi:hypothetical protein